MGLQRRQVVWPETLLSRQANRFWIRICLSGQVQPRRGKRLAESIDQAVTAAISDRQRCYDHIVFEMSLPGSNAIETSAMSGTGKRTGPFQEGRLSMEKLAQFFKLGANLAKALGASERWITLLPNRLGMEGHRVLIEGMPDGNARGIDVLAPSSNLKDIESKRVTHFVLGHDIQDRLANSWQLRARLH